VHNGNGRTDHEDGLTEVRAGAASDQVPRTRGSRADESVPAKAVRRRFDPVTALKVIERDRVTVIEGVPTMYVALLHAGTEVADTSTLRLAISGGAALPVEVLRGFEQAFDTVILEGYGLSETSPVATFNTPTQRKPGSIGVPIAGVELKLVDVEGEVGEIAIRGHNVMKGYWGKPEATAETLRGGWLHTGDLACRDADGYLWFRGRSKQIIVRAGSNISPQEIEEALYQHPAVLEVGVTGQPDPLYGERVVAFVALRQGASADEAELQAFARERLADYKTPERILFLPELPKGLTGKVDRRSLKEMLLAETGAIAAEA
jgi:long-chain acyl-CoA synthetase